MLTCFIKLQFAHDNQPTIWQWQAKELWDIDSRATNCCMKVSKNGASSRKMLCQHYSIGTTIMWFETYKISILLALVWANRKGAHRQKRWCIGGARAVSTIVWVEIPWWDQWEGSKVSVMGKEGATSPFFRDTLYKIYWFLRPCEVWSSSQNVT